MEEYRYKWQIFVGAFLLLCLIVMLFFPYMSISGEDYVNMAVEVHEYARESNSEAADQAGAKEFLEQYQREGAVRSSLTDSYDNRISQKTGDHPHISGLYLGRWGLRVTDNLYFDGIIYQPEAPVENSGVQSVFHWMSVLILLPAVLGAILLVFMLAKRRTYALWLLLVGVITVVSELLLYFTVPSMIWGKVDDYVASFSLIPSELLEIPGVGEKVVTELYQGCLGVTVWIVLAVGGLITVAGILFLTVCRPKRISQQQTETPEVGWTNPNQQLLGMGQVPAKGVITGIQGQYRGQNLSVEVGEELILGRDPAYCMLIFEHPGISRRHCGIRYDARTGSYRVIDYSSTGTRLEDGTMVSASAYTVVTPGTVIYLGNTGEALQLG